MVIHGSGYRKLSYEPTSMLRRLLPIGAMEFRAMFRSRWGILGLICCAVPSLVSLFLMTVRFGAWQFMAEGPGVPRGRGLPGLTSRADPYDIAFYLDPILRESFLVFVLLTTVVSCRAIAKDRGTQALEIYWTRAITPLGYFLAKWLGSAALLGVLFVGCPLLLWILAVFMAPDWGLFTTTIHFVPQVLLGLSALTLLLTYLAVALSALADRPNFATILWMILIAGSLPLVEILARAFRGQYWVHAFSPWQAGARIVNWIAGVTPVRDYPVWIAFAVLGGMLALVTLLMSRRLRLVEAIA
ncbi:MAG: hypothetical protein IT458_03515 [Planctomycetes bacterium]|nr:hypothetical protein [Planctomycetota bacterium]